MNTNMTGFRFRNICILVIWTKVASAFGGRRISISPEPTLLPGVHKSYGGKKLYCGGLVKKKTVIHCKE